MIKLINFSSGLTSTTSDLKVALELERAVKPLTDTIQHYRAKDFATQGFNVLVPALIPELLKRDAALLEDHLRSLSSGMPGEKNPRVIDAIKPIATEIFEQSNYGLRFQNVETMATHLAFHLDVATSIAFCEALARKVLETQNLGPLERKLAESLIEDLTKNIPTLYGLAFDPTTSRLSRNWIDPVDTSVARLQRKLSFREEQLDLDTLVMPR